MSAWITECTISDRGRSCATGPLASDHCRSDLITSRTYWTAKDEENSGKNCFRGRYISICIAMYWTWRVMARNISSSKTILAAVSLVFICLPSTKNLYTELHMGCAGPRLPLYWNYVPEKIWSAVIRRDLSANASSPATRERPRSEIVHSVIHALRCASGQD